MGSRDITRFTFPITRNAQSCRRDLWVRLGPKVHPCWGVTVEAITRVTPTSDREQVYSVVRLRPFSDAETVISCEIELPAAAMERLCRTYLARSGGVEDPRLLEYVAQNEGLRCPRCGSQDLDSNRLTTNVNGAPCQDVTCGACGAWWTDVYRIDRVEDFGCLESDEVD